MKQQVKKPMQSGFTLIELIIVVAILAFITVIGIHSYANIKDVQAKKINVANIKSVYHSLATYDAIREDVFGRFNNFDSLIDAPESGYFQQGKAGSYDWDDTKDIIYDGNYKKYKGSPVEMEAAMDKNQGITDELKSKLGLYYLTQNEIDVLKKAGVGRYLYHNWWKLNPENNPPEGAIAYTWGGGGPSFRPDMSGYLSVPLSTNYVDGVAQGPAVCVIRPDAKCESVAGYVYNHLGYSLTNNYTSIGTTAADMTKLLNGKTKLIVFGIGRGSECVLSQLGLGEVPYNPVYNHTYYRNYLAVYALYAGGRGVVATARLVGVLDCKGNTWEGASYGMKWQTSEN